MVCFELLERLVLDRQSMTVPARLVTRQYKSGLVDNATLAALLNPMTSQQLVTDDYVLEYFVQCVT